MTKKELLSKAISVEEFNTNNGWGFGGSIGKRYNFGNGIILVLRRICYRHLPSDDAFECFVDGKVVDELDGGKFKKSHIDLMEKLINERSCNDS